MQTPKANFATIVFKFFRQFFKDAFTNITRVGMLPMKNSFVKKKIVFVLDLIAATRIMKTAKTNLENATKLL